MENRTQVLVQRALSGDREGMRRLVTEVLYPVIEGRLARRCAIAGAARQELSDAVQEVLVHLLDRDAAVLRRWDPARGGLEAYVATVAGNLTISMLRKKTPQPTADVDRRASIDETPEDNTSYSHLVRRLLREMSDDEAALFFAVYMEELSPDEAAARLGIGREAVYKRVQRLRRHLREVMSTAAAPVSLRRSGP